MPFSLIDAIGKIQTLTREEASDPLLASTKLTQAEKAFLRQVATYGNKDGKNIFPTVQQMAKDTGTSRSQAFELLKHIKLKGFLIPDDDKEKRRSVRYQIPLDQFGQVAPRPPVLTEEEAFELEHKKEIAAAKRRQKTLAHFVKMVDAGELSQEEWAMLAEHGIRRKLAVLRGGADQQQQAARSARAGREESMQIIRMALAAGQSQQVNVQLDNSPYALPQPPVTVTLPLIPGQGSSLTLEQAINIVRFPRPAGPDVMTVDADVFWPAGQQGEELAADLAEELPDELFEELASSQQQPSPTGHDLASSQQQPAAASSSQQQGHDLAELAPVVPSGKQQPSPSGEGLAELASNGHQPAAAISQQQPSPSGEGHDLAEIFTLDDASFELGMSSLEWQQVAAITDIPKGLADLSPLEQKIALYERLEVAAKWKYLDASKTDRRKAKYKGIWEGAYTYKQAYLQQRDSLIVSSQGNGSRQ